MERAGEGAGPVKKVFGAAAGRGAWTMVCSVLTLAIFALLAALYSEQDALRAARAKAAALPFAAPCEASAPPGSGFSPQSGAAALPSAGGALGETRSQGGREGSSAGSASAIDALGAAPCAAAPVAAPPPPHARPKVVDR